MKILKKNMQIFKNSLHSVDSVLVKCKEVIMICCKYFDFVYQMHCVWYQMH